MISFLSILYFRSFLRWIRCWYRYHCWKRRIQRSFCYWNVRHFQQVSFVKKKNSDVNSLDFLKISKLYFRYLFFYRFDQNCWPRYDPDMTHIWPLSFREILQLTWWPLFRDCSFYIVSLLVLIWAFYDSSITWWVIKY